MPVSLGVIGLGRMAEAVILPLLNQGDFLPEDFFSVVGHPASVKRALDHLPDGMRVVSSDDSSALKVWSAPIQLLAVKPQQLDIVQSQALQATQFIKTTSRPILISLLAGVTLEKLKEVFPHHCCFRAVPNTPVLVGAGLTGLAWSDGVTSEQIISVRKLFDPISEVLELPEHQLDAYLALASSGPAFVALMAEALADGAVAAGLPRLLAHYLAHRTFAGTALLLKEKEIHPGELKDMVASPGGTTIKGLRHLEKSGVRSALMEAVVMAAERSREMSG